jgi:hypothetical protein
MYASGTLVGDAMGDAEGAGMGVFGGGEEGARAASSWSAGVLMG